MHCFGFRSLETRSTCFAARRLASLSRCIIFYRPRCVTGFLFIKRATMSQRSSFAFAPPTRKQWRSFCVSFSLLVWRVCVPVATAIGLHIHNMEVHINTITRTRHTRRWIRTRTMQHIFHNPKRLISGQMASRSSTGGSKCRSRHWIHVNSFFCG